MPVQSGSQLVGLNTEALAPETAAGAAVVCKAGQNSAIPYALPTQCPDLCEASRQVSHTRPPYALAMRCPVLTQRLCYRPTRVLRGVRYTESAHAPTLCYAMSSTETAYPPTRVLRSVQY
eukprot:2872372-Rhodomonas_salina.1